MKRFRDYLRSLMLPFRIAAILFGIGIVALAVTGWLVGNFKPIQSVEDAFFRIGTAIALILTGGLFCAVTVDVGSRLYRGNRRDSDDG